MKICAYLMVKNGALNLKYTLPVLKNQVDHIYVLDTGSVDNTVEICKRYADYVDEEKFSGYFNFNIGKMRNKAMDRACELFPDCDYLMHIDHDECFSPLLFEILKTVDMSNYDGIDLSRWRYTFLKEEGVLKAKFNWRKTLVRVRDSQEMYDPQQRIYRKHLRFGEKNERVLHRRVPVLRKYTLYDFYFHHFCDSLSYRGLLWAENAHKRGRTREQYLRDRWLQPEWQPIEQDLKKIFGFNIEALFDEWYNMKYNPIIECNY